MQGCGQTQDWRNDWHSKAPWERVKGQEGDHDTGQNERKKGSLTQAAGVKQETNGQSLRAMCTHMVKE